MRIEDEECGVSSGVVESNAENCVRQVVSANHHRCAYALEMLDELFHLVHQIASRLNIDHAVLDADELIQQHLNLETANPLFAAHKFGRFISHSDERFLNFCVGWRRGVSVAL